MRPTSNSGSKRIKFNRDNEKVRDAEEEWYKRKRIALDDYWDRVELHGCSWHELPIKASESPAGAD